MLLFYTISMTIQMENYIYVDGIVVYGIYDNSDGNQRVENICYRRSKIKFILCYFISTEVKYQFTDKLTWGKESTTKKNY